MRRGAGSIVVAILFAQLCLAGDCVDGVTPDCSDAAARCGPELDGAASVDASDATTPDATIDAATTSDGASDADVDADATDQ